MRKAEKGTIGVGGYASVFYAGSEILVAGGGCRGACFRRARAGAVCPTPSVCAAPGNKEVLKTEQPQPLYKKIKNTIMVRCV
jgi:hypothetical protein